jgi:hypothetical protein
MSTTVQRNKCPEHTTVGRMVSAGTRIKPSVISCLAPAHREVDLSAHY